MTPLEAIKAAIAAANENARLRRYVAREERVEAFAGAGVVVALPGEPHPGLLARYEQNVEPVHTREQLGLFGEPRGGA